MTDKTDIEALREAALKATAGEWYTDSQHCVIADAGLNANYYVAACPGPDSKANAKFISLANPATILALLDQIEAERQRADDEQELNKHLDLANRASEGVNASLRRQVEKAEAELAALKGEQIPVAWITWHQGFRAPDDCEEYLNAYTYATKEKSCDGSDAIPLFAHPAKPVVVLPKIRDSKYWNGVEIRCDKYQLDVQAVLETAGIVVKDGE